MTVRAALWLALLAACTGPARAPCSVYVANDARCWVIAPRVYPGGLFKFRTLAEAQAARERVSDESIRRLRPARTAEET